MFDRARSNCVGLPDPEDEDAMFLGTLGITGAYADRPPLALICSRSLDTGKFLSRLKFSIVRPIFKKGDNSFMSN